MAAGYELTQLRPGTGEYKTVPKAVRPILQFIFEEGFPHSISKVCYPLFSYCACRASDNTIFYFQIIAQDFFDVPLPEVSKFDPTLVSIHFQVHVYNFRDTYTLI